MTTPYPYQNQGVKTIESFGGRALLADEMGLGKSLSALLYIRNHPEARPVVVVCPASLKYNWVREAEVHVKMRVAVLEGQKPPSGGLAVAEPLVVINYDILQHWVSHLRKLKPKIVILDESHYLGNRATKRTKSCKALCDKVPHVLALSGTPLVNRPVELYPTLNILRGDLFPAFYSFAHRWCGPTFGPYGWNFNGSSNTEELNNLLSKHLMVRRLKKDVLDQLPAKSRQIVLLDMDERKEYEHALTNFKGWLMQYHPEKVGKTDRAAALAQITHLKGIIARGKLRPVTDWIDSFLRQTDRKLLVFCVRRLVVQALCTKYKGLCARVDGSVTGKDRQLAFDRFTRDPKCRVFVGNIKAAGVGWNGTAASDVCFVELGWTPGEHTQAEDRIHRIGQKGAAVAHYLIARDTIEEKICKLIQKKQETADAVLDGGKVIQSLDVFDQLLKALKKEMML